MFLTSISLSGPVRVECLGSAVPCAVEVFAIRAVRSPEHLAGRGGVRRVSHLLMAVITPWVTLGWVFESLKHKSNPWVVRKSINLSDGYFYVNMSFPGSYFIEPFNMCITQIGYTWDCVLHFDLSCIYVNLASKTRLTCHALELVFTPHTIISCITWHCTIITGISKLTLVTLAVWPSAS